MCVLPYPHILGIEVAPLENTMSRKQLVLFGTRHWPISGIPNEIQSSLRVLISKFQPDVALEEWSTVQGQRSGLAAVCDSLKVPWENIGTPPDPKFKTYDHTAAADFPATINVVQYGPLGTQEQREEAMRESIVRAMSSRSVALVLVGVAHLHSMMLKLSSDFLVSGYAYRLEVF